MAERDVRKAPRVTLNALAEYLDASAGRRRTIVTEQRRPKTFRVTYYGEAEEAIAAALAANMEEEPLTRGWERIEALPAAKPWDAARREAGLEALQCFRRFVDDGRGKDLPPLRRASQRPRPLVVAGVWVSVRPELLIESEEGVAVGGLKLFFSKTATLNEERAKYAAAVLHLYVEQVLGGGTDADYRNCFVLDVFGRTLHVAPRTYRRRRQDVEAACGEIAAIWEGL